MIPVQINLGRHHYFFFPLLASNCRAFFVLFVIHCGIYQVFWSKPQLTHSSSTSASSVTFFKLVTWIPRGVLLLFLISLFNAEVMLPCIYLLHSV